MFHVIGLDILPNDPLVMAVRALNIQIMQMETDEERKRFKEMFKD